VEDLFCGFHEWLRVYGHEIILTFSGALSASPTYADDDTNQNNYGNKTSDDNGSNE
jgi:hypothetical protein